MRAPRANQVTGNDAGVFLVKVQKGSKWVDVSRFRGSPTKILSMSTADPFGPATAEIELTSVTSFDRFGVGELAWLRQWANVNIVWTGTKKYTWEGFITSIEVGATTRIQLRGALYVCDNYLAAPFYPTNPVPYETLIKRACAPANSRTSLAAMKTVFPKGWSVIAKDAKENPSYLWMLSPWGIAKGKPWTGLATRSTGGWDQGLTGHVQSLLSTMYTPEGDQWTLMLDQGRKPVLRVRKELHNPDANTIYVTNGLPGVQISLSKDWSQSANVIYGAGSDFAGVSFSNMKVDPTGATTTYEPFAYVKGVHPNTSANPMYNPKLTRKESRLSFAQGVDQIAAFDVAQSHLRRFADPGWIGSISLQIDPVDQNNIPINRFLMQAGMTVVVENWCGSDVFLHVTKCDVSPEDGVANLTVDSRYRDALTADEVYARTRDALNPLNALKVGQQSITINDLVKPWSYNDGSGMMPTAVKDLFKLPDGNLPFPWTKLTKLYPPKKFPQYYVKVSPSPAHGRNSCWQRPQSNGADLPFTEVVVSNGKSSTSKIWAQAVVIRMAQAGTIRLSQIAAYDKDGNVLPVEFHFALYNNTVNVSNMPYPESTKIPQRKPAPGDISERYPFFLTAFEQYKPTGEQQTANAHLLPAGAEMLTGWGTYHEPAGYSPGLYSKGNKKTGMLIDEAPWQFDTTGQTGFDPYSASKTKKNAEAGCLYGMIYCDDTLLTNQQEIYFMGRFFISPQGSA